MVRSHKVMVWNVYLAKKSLLGGGEWLWQTKFNVSPGQGLWSLVLGPFGPDLGPGPGPELDNICLSNFWGSIFPTKNKQHSD